MIYIKIISNSKIELIKYKAAFNLITIIKKIIRISLSSIRAIAFFSFNRSFDGRIKSKVIFYC